MWNASVFGHAGEGDPIFARVEKSGGDTNAASLFSKGFDGTYEYRHDMLPPVTLYLPVSAKEFTLPCRCVYHYGKGKVDKVGGR